MNILRWYCLSQLRTPFLMSLMVFTFILMMGNLVELADLLVNKGVSVFDVAKLVLLIAPSVIGFIIPTAVLASVLLTFGGMSQGNEIIAMKANGVHFAQVIVPVMAVSFFLSLFSLFLIDQVQPRAEFHTRQLVRSMILKRPSAYLDAGRWIRDFKNHKMWIKEINGDRLHGVTIFQSEDGKPTRMIIAKWAQIIGSADEESFSLILHEGTSDEPQEADKSAFYKLNFKTMELPDISIGRYASGKGKKPREMALDELFYELRFGDSLNNGKPHERRKFQAELHKRIAISFAPFIFTLIGLGLGVVTRRGEAVVSFGIAGLVLALYYVLLVSGDAIAVKGALPPMLALWLPNLILGALGVFFLRRAVRT